MCSLKQNNLTRYTKKKILPQFRENKLSLIYESDNFIIVDKPYDMYINCDDENEKNTVAYRIGKHDSHLASSERPLHFIHRLDYATSGILCVAKNKPAAARAGMLLQRRAVNKYYLAVVRGHMHLDAADILYPIGELERTATTNHKMLAITSAEDEQQCRRSRAAHTRLMVLERGYYHHQRASILLLKPNTGRRHQLRAHCHSIGHTILGDYTYSDGADHLPHRMFLHATRLSLEETGVALQTDNAFLSDRQFAANWESLLLAHPHHDRQDFVAACHHIDKLVHLPQYQYQCISPRRDQRHQPNQQA